MYLIRSYDNTTKVPYCKLVKFKQYIFEGLEGSWYIALCVCSSAKKLKVLYLQVLQKVNVVLGTR